MIDINKFIENNIDLIERGRWLDLYGILRVENLDDISRFNQILYEAGINPLEDLYVVPQLFLAWAPLHSIDIPDHVRSIGKHAFYESSVDDTLKLPKSLELIQSQAFSGCKNIKHLVLPDNLVRIEEKAFYDCTNLTSIVMGENIQYVMHLAFELCPNLKDVYYKGSEKDWNRIDMTPHSFYMDEDDEYPFTIHYNYNKIIDTQEQI